MLQIQQNFFIIIAVVVIIVAGGVGVCVGERERDRESTIDICVHMSAKAVISAL